MFEYTSYGLVLSVSLGFAGILLLWMLYINRDRHAPPGPFAYPVIGNLHLFLSNSDNVLKTFRQLRLTYGDIYSLKLGFYDAVVVNGYKNLKELLMKKEVSNRPEMFFFTDVVRTKGLIGTSGNIWKANRAFAIKTLRNIGHGKRNIETRIMEEVTVFLQEIESRSDMEIDLDGLIQTSVANAVCSIVFGQRFRYTDERFSNLMHIFTEHSRLIGPGSLISIFPFLQYVPGDPFKGQLLIRNVDRLMMFIAELVNDIDTTGEENETNNYIDAYMKENSHHNDTSKDSELVNHIADFSTLKWAVLYLIHNQDVQSKMRRELYEVVGTSHPPSLKDRANLPYYEAVITEVLRCACSTPLSIHHVCSEDVYFRGFTIPKWTLVIPNLNSAVTDQDVFNNPSVFDPERYIDDDGKFQAHENVITFGIGRRVCLGETIARSKLFLYLTSLVQRFRFEAVDVNNPPPLQGIVGITHMPKSYEFRAIKMK